VRIDCSAIELPEYPNHPNRLPFLGILGFTDSPSEAAPAGSRNHRVILTRQAALDALPSLVGMGICRSPDNDTHESQRKIGIITKAYLLGARIVVRGIIYASDCRVDVVALRKGKFGMSYEVADGKVIDMRASIWTLNKVHFKGAAVLLAEKAAYKKTRFWLASK